VAEGGLREYKGGDGESTNWCAHPLPEVDWRISPGSYVTLKSIYGYMSLILCIWVDGYMAICTRHQKPFMVLKYQGIAVTGKKGGHHGRGHRGNRNTTEYAMTTAAGGD
jgi:hypothetical protein